MATSVQSIIDIAAGLLKDTDLTRWTEDDLVYYLSEGQTEIIGKDVSANTVATPVLLAAGITQSIPADCIEMVDITMNLGREWAADTVYYPGQKVFSGTTRYTCLTGHTSSALFATDAANWATASYSSGIKIDQISEANVDVELGEGWSVMEDNEDINYEPIVSYWVVKEGPQTYNHFSVYPGQPETGRMYVEMLYAQDPGLLDIGDDITIADKYRAALLDYVLFRAFSKDNDNEANAQVAMSYWNKFDNGPMFANVRR